ncbi:MAG: helix-turn-helix domain-containing protein [Bacteroidetes bacterium]|nr:helix-turn-helix domain-containing protein [Bacteroidota bacterium]MBU1113494.1 helix-turn-helix domain-containing protein [Bacteroidota bacterium]
MNFIPELSFAGLVISIIFFLISIISIRIDREGKKYISIIMFFSSFLFLYDYLLITNQIEILKYLVPFLYPIIFSLFPLLYNYLIHISSDKNDRLIIKIFNLLPPVSFIVFTIFYLTLSDVEKNQIILINYLEFNFVEIKYVAFLSFIYISYYLQFTIFVVIFSQLFFEHKKRKEILIGNNKAYLPNWLFVIISSIIFYELIYTASYLLLDFSDTSIILSQIANLIILIIVAVLSVRHDQLLLEIKLSLSCAGPAVKKYAESEIVSENQKKEIISLLIELMEKQKIYRSPKIKLEILAKKMALPVNKLSQIINSEFNMNFSQFVNKYRIEEAIELLKNSNRNFEDVFLEIGFYTRSTFNRAFKAHTGNTPSEYLKTKA